MDRFEAPAVTDIVPVGDVRRGRIGAESVVIVAFDEHAGRLKAFALHASRDADVADDLVQETFLRLVAEVRSGPVPDDLGAWLFRVCGNLIVSRGRRMAVAARMRSFLVDRRPTISPEERAIRTDENTRVTDALATLPGDARVALLMAAAGYSSAEIGRAIGRTENATMSYLCRSRIRLRDRLAVVEEERS